jgi:SAM-dependent methyltransferase
MFLEESKKRQYIPEYEVQNAEQLTFADRSFDFVLCKEAYHHFPRPTVALYEMLRVARRAVVLIEPQDEYPPRPLTRLKVLIKRITGRQVLPGYHWYEPAGNYVYTISKRELTKLSLGVGLSHVAFKAMNSYHVAGLEELELARHKKTYRKLRLMILLQDMLTRMRGAHAGLLVAILFKEPPTNALSDLLRASGYEVVTLPRNPYLGVDEVQQQESSGASLGNGHS